MSYEILESPVELTDVELDAVAAGAAKNKPFQKGLVNANIEIENNQVNVLSQKNTN